MTLSSTTTTSTPFRILIINPNTTTSMTEALIAPINKLHYTNTLYTFHTNPSPDGPGSINNPLDALQSTDTIISSLLPLLDGHDAFLVACFSPHPLVARLRALIAKSERPRRPVTGIFEASVTAALEGCSHATSAGAGAGDAVAGSEDDGGMESRWVIVTTAEGWREALSCGVGDVCGSAQGWEWDYREHGYAMRKFGGVETTGLNADELHRTPKEVVDARMAEALGRLVDFWETKRQRLSVVVLGCAGMVGWEEKIRKEMRKRYGKGAEGEVLVIDPVKSGVGSLQSALRAEY